MSIQSPNMGLPVPTPSVDDGPAWADNVQTSLNIIDAHTHNAGSGVPITPDGININADLSFNTSNNLTLVRSVRFALTSTGSIASASPDTSCIFVSTAGELYYNDTSGNQVQITSGGSVNAGAGSITGLPSGTASASYTALSGTFTLQQATSTAANLDIGTLIVRYPGSYPTPSGNHISIQAPSSLASAYSITLPAIPASQKFVTLDSSGNLAAPWAVDASTLEIASGTTLQIKDSGVTTAKIADSAVTTAKIAASAVTTTKIADANVSTEKLQTNINLPGTNPTAASRSILTLYTFTTSTTTVIRGIFDSTQTFVAGEGWSLTKNAVGQYTITYSIPFSSLAVPVVSVYATNAKVHCYVSIVATTGFQVTCVDNSTNLGVDVGISFMVIGPA